MNVQMGASISQVALGFYALAGLWGTLFYAADAHTLVRFCTAA